MPQSERDNLSLGSDYDMRLQWRVITFWVSIQPPGKEAAYRGRDNGIP